MRHYLKHLSVFLLLCAIGLTGCATNKTNKVGNCISAAPAGIQLHG